LPPANYQPGIVLPEQFYRHKNYYQQERRQLMITVIASIRAIRSIDDESEFDRSRELAVCYFDARGLTGSGFNRDIAFRGSHWWNCQPTGEICFSW
jgi:hypothetical protein